MLDTKVVFSYYRIVEGNRLILGGGNAISSFLPFEFDYDLVIRSEKFQENLSNNAYQFPILSIREL